ncbi:hypothetical protein JHK87_007416 [Glycine soja]|nr:hypothetical protein JHK87_007416 [Glycine soja]
MEKRYPVARRSSKRKLEADLTEDQTHTKASKISAKILKQVSLLNSAAIPFTALDCATVKSAVHSLSVLAANEDLVDTILNCGVVPALVRHLRLTDNMRKYDGHEAETVKDYSDGVTEHDQFDVVKRCAVILELLAIEQEYQQLIVDAGALPCLVDWLRMQKISTTSQPLIDLLKRVADAITSLIHENNGIKTLFRMEGGIAPLVELLEFNDIKVQRAAARALRTLAFKNDGNKNQIVESNALPTLVLMLQSEDPKTHYEAVHICQRGAIPPLVDMLRSPDAELQEMSAFALGRLAQDSHNQAGIGQCGGIEPLLKLLDSKKVPVQQNAIFALYSLADNEDNVAAIIKADGFRKLKAGNFRNQVLKHLIHLMRFAEAVQRRVAIALAYLCSPRDRKTIFINNNGLKLLLDTLKSSNLKQKSDASAALHKLAIKASSSFSLFDIASPSPTLQMYFGDEYVNNPKLSDVTFLVEGGEEVFMLIEIVYFLQIYFAQCLMAVIGYIYTGTVDVNLDIAQDLLRAADQYLLDGLKRICEYTISQEISEENVSLLYKMSEDFNATSLKHSCILFMLEKFDKLRCEPWYVIFFTTWSTSVVYCVYLAGCLCTGSIQFMKSNLSFIFITISSSFQHAGIVLWFVTFYQTYACSSQLYLSNLIQLIRENP